MIDCNIGKEPVKSCSFSSLMDSYFAVKLLLNSKYWYILTLVNVDYCSPPLPQSVSCFHVWQCVCVAADYSENASSCLPMLSSHENWSSLQMPAHSSPSGAGSRSVLLPAQLFTAASTSEQINNKKKSNVKDFKVKIFITYLWRNVKIKEMFLLLFYFFKFRFGKIIFKCFSK